MYYKQWLSSKPVCLKPIAMHRKEGKDIGVDLLYPGILTPGTSLPITKAHINTHTVGIPLRKLELIRPIY